MTFRCSDLQAWNEVFLDLDPGYYFLEVFNNKFYFFNCTLSGPGSSAHSLGYIPSPIYFSLSQSWSRAFPGLLSHLEWSHAAHPFMSI